MFVTSESEDAVRTAIDEEGLGGTWVSVDPLRWERWELANPKRPELPLPGTIVIGPDGVVDSVHTYVNYMKRRDATETIDQIGEAQTQATAEAHATGEAAIDFDSAVGLRSQRTAQGVVLYLDIAEDFVVYGAKEKQAVPLSVELTSTSGRAQLPPGDKKLTETGPQRVLRGAASIPIRVRGNPSIVEDVITYQVCYETLCAPPTTSEWAIQR